MTEQFTKHIDKIKNFLGLDPTFTASKMPIDYKLEKCLEKALRELREQNKMTYWFYAPLKESMTFVSILNKPLNEKRQLVFYLISRVQELTLKNRKNEKRNKLHLLSAKEPAYLDFLTGILRSHLKFSDQEIFDLLKTFKIADEKGILKFAVWPVTYVIQQLERNYKKNLLSKDMKIYLKEVLTWSQMKEFEGYRRSDIKKIRHKITEMVL